MTSTSKWVLTLATLAIALVSGGVYAQDNPTKLSDADVKKFKPHFMKLVEKKPRGYDKKAIKDRAARKVAEAKLIKAIEAWSKKNDDRSPLADWESFADLLREQRISAYPKRHRGAGKMVDVTTWFKIQGECFEFEYAYRVPKSYDPKKPMPIVLCIHGNPKNSGKEYLKRVWLTGKDNEALAENFILVAPSLPRSLTARKKIKSGPYKGKEAIGHAFEWFDSRTVRILIQSLKEVQGVVNTDSSRVFVEGNGRGAEYALQLASVFGIELFAGAVARQGVMPKDHRNVMDGLVNVPVMMLQRAPHAKEKNGKARWGDWQEMKAAIEAKKADAAARKTAMDTKIGAAKKDDVAQLEKEKSWILDWSNVVIEEMTDPPESLNPKVEAREDVEPVIDANAKVAAFYGQHQALACPKHFRIVSDTALFVNANRYLRFTQHEISTGKTVNVKVDIDDDTNTIFLTGENFSALSVFLSDGVLNLDKLVRIVVNGVSWTETKVPRELSRMLSSMRGSPFTTHRVTTALITTSEEETN